MTELVRPDVRFRESWQQAVEEHAADGTFMHGSGLWDLGDSVPPIEEVVENLLRMDQPDVELPEGRVRCTYYWITDADEFVGCLALRHSLTAWLLEEGGHIGYSVRPSRRRQGHATRALALSLDRARALGLDRVLITADEDNRPSQLVIERCGGRYEDTRKGKRRYWIELGT